MISRNLIARVELLSDVHIGTGTELVRDIDWLAPGDGWVYVANSERLQEEVFLRAEAEGMKMREVARVLAGSTMGDLVKMKWITPADYGADHPLFRYRLRGSPATANIREQIKDVHGKPYLPGSSLKGALRTVMAVSAASQVKPDLRRMGSSRTWAGQPVEQQLFGQDPNHDLLRVLQVGDSQPVDPSHLRLRRAHIYPTASKTYRGRSRGLDVDIETLAIGTVLECPIHIPTELLQDRGLEFDSRRRRELGPWEEQSKWLEGLAEAGRDNARTLLEGEVLFYQNRKDVPAAHRFFHELVEVFTKLKRNEFLLVIGWGGGWHTKTLNQVLRRDPKFFDDLVAKYRLNPTGTHKEGDPFPKSRHLLRINEQPGPPLGWVKVTLLPQGSG